MNAADRAVISLAPLADEQARVKGVERDVHDVHEFAEIAYKCTTPEGRGDDPVDFSDRWTQSQFVRACALVKDARYLHLRDALVEVLKGRLTLSATEVAEVLDASDIDPVGDEDWEDLKRALERS